MKTFKILSMYSEGTSHHVFAFLIFGILILFSCKEHVEKTCFNPKGLDSPEIFSECVYGSGNFGRWIIDEFALPAYEYTLSQERQDIALWWNSEERQRREHWHQIGNSRISALAYNEGYTELFTQEGGFKFINYYDEQEQNFSGGFAYVYDGQNIWATAYKYRPDNSTTVRIFGVNYFFSEIQNKDISISRYVFSPQDDLPMLITDVIIKNTGKTKKDILYYEYWDVNFHNVIPELITSGLLDKSIPKNIREKRKKYNSKFLQKGFIKENIAFVETYLKEEKNNSEDSAEYDRNPPYVFLATLDRWNDQKSSLNNLGYIFDQKTFFQAKDSMNFGSLDFDKEIYEVPGEGQTLALIHGRKISIEPGQILKLRYAYGYTYSADDFQIPQKYEEEDLLQNVIDFWRKRLVYFSTADESYIQREMTWHSYYILSSAYYRRYFGLHTVSQGGSYLFMHGYDGAPRDYCIFSVALNHIDPYLSKEILKFIMRMTYENGEIPYANYGDVFPVKIDLVKPSDLDIFFLWAVAEYILATRDFGFLGERVKFYDSEKETTVLERIKVSFNHLFNVVGLGENGLIKFRTGDWSDGIRFFADNIEELEKTGESVFNTAFAVAILPRLADVLENFDKDFSYRIRQIVEKLRNSLEKTWNGKWYLRGIYGSGKKLGGDDRIFLEPQVWAMIGGVVSGERIKILINSIKENLETDLGAMIVYPPSEDVKKRTGLSFGTDVNGGIWPAINSLLTWAYSLYDPALAWESFKKNTLAKHAELYPNLWYGIWSGPDSYNSPISPRPGEAAVQFATSLADFPVMNANSHANPIIALLKLLGINSYKEGFEFSPKIQKDFNLKLPYIGIKFTTNKIEGYFKSITDIPEIKIKVKVKDIPKTIKVNGVETDFVLSDNRSVSFSVKLSPGELVRWEIF